ncbi:MAG: TolC family protein [Bacteriovoracaceae bacterium]|nr:TolC family protein [Bacteriovoracaceae bacterium]
MLGMLKTFILCGAFLLLLPLAAQESDDARVTADQNSPADNARTGNTTDDEEDLPSATSQTAKKIPDIATDEQLDPTINRQAKSAKVKKAPEQFLQEVTPTEDNTAAYKSLHLGEAVEQGLRTSAEQAVRDLKIQYYDLDWDRKFQEFWWPHITLYASTAPYRLGRIKKGKREGTPYERPAGGHVGLEIADYTIFNWGKDYQHYLNAKTEYLRRQEALTEERRDLKHNIIYHYFNLYTAQQIEKVLRQQLRQASFIYRLNRERLSAGKTSKQEYFQARGLYLQAQQKYFAGQTQFRQACAQMASYLHDPDDTRYVAIDPLRFQKYEGSLEEEIRLGKDNNPRVKEAQKDIIVQEREHHIAKLDRLPLPRISIRLGVYDQNLGQNRHSAHYANQEGDDHLDLVARIQATWDLVGPQGFFNTRQSKEKFLAAQIATQERHAAQDSVENQIRQIHQAILQAQNDVEIWLAQVENTKQQYDTAINNYLKQRTTFLDYQKALEDRTQAEIAWRHASFEHIAQKIALAMVMGVENPPTEILERLIGQGE